jgi:hypothetical protein
VKKLFATKDVSTLTTGYLDYTFSLPNGQTYQIQSGDRIGIKYTGGTATTNNISIMRDTTIADPFDGTNSYLTYYTTTWLSATANDLYMILKGNSTPTDTTAPITTASPLGGTYTSAQSVTLNANEPATIYYTTDGSPPTISSTVYTTPIPISATTPLKFFAKDTVGNSETVQTLVYTITLGLPVTHMSDTTASSGWAIYSTRSILAEYVTPTSQLVGDNIDTIILKLKNSGATGTAQIGVFNTDLSVKKLFATKDVSTLTTSYVDYTFSLPSGQTYQIQSGDRIGIKYTGGDGTTNNISIMRDAAIADPFDGVNSYHTYYTTSWLSATSNDLYMILRQTSP